MSGSPDPAAVGAEIEALLRRIEGAGDAQASGHAQELVRLLMSLYGAGLSRMLDVVRTESGGPQAVLDRFAADGLIASLLVLHDLHPHPVHVRVERAVATLQPHLPPHITVSVLAVDEGSARIRVESAPNGTGSGSGLRASIERAIGEAAPEIGAIEIEGLDDGAAGGLIQITRRSDAAARPTVS